MQKTGLGGLPLAAVIVSAAVTAAVSSSAGKTVTHSYVFLR
jgi:adenosylmethionine-8-amino-7-oxononanoate aminotransferase